MRILHTADWHLGRSLEGRSRTEEQMLVLEEITNIVREQEIDLVLIAGDIYDSVNPPAVSEQMFYEAITRMSEGGKRHVQVIAGNHDHPDRLAASAPLAHKQGIGLHGLPSSHIVELPITRTGEIACLYALPYPSEARLQQVLSEQFDEEALRTAYSHRVRLLVEEAVRHFRADATRLIMSHLYVLGGRESDSERPIQVGGAYTVDTSALDGVADYVALGHLHRAQNLKSDRLIRYSGSPLAYSFSEAGQMKSVTVVDLQPGVPALQFEEIPLTSGRPLVAWQAEGGLLQVDKWLEEGRDARAWIDLTLHLEQALTMEQIQQLRRRHSGLIHIRPVFPEMEAAAAVAAEKLPLPELFRRFFKRQTGGAEPDDALVSLFLELVEPSDHTLHNDEEEAHS